MDLQMFVTFRPRRKSQESAHNCVESQAFHTPSVISHHILCELAWVELSCQLSDEHQTYKIGVKHGSDLVPMSVSPNSSPDFRFRHAGLL